MWLHSNNVASTEIHFLKPIIFVMKSLFLYILTCPSMVTVTCIISEIPVDILVLVRPFLSTSGLHIVQKVQLKDKLSMDLSFFNYLSGRDISHKMRNTLPISVQPTHFTQVRNISFFNYLISLHVTQMRNTLTIWSANIFYTNEKWRMRFTKDTHTIKPTYSRVSVQNDKLSSMGGRDVRSKETARSARQCVPPQVVNKWLTYHRAIKPSLPPWATLTCLLETGRSLGRSTSSHFIFISFFLLFS